MRRGLPGSECLLAVTGHVGLSREKSARHEHLAGSPTEIDGNFRKRVLDQAKMIAMSVAQKDAVDLWAGTEQTRYVLNNTAPDQVIPIRFAPS